MSQVSRSLAGLRARCVRLEEVVERNARALGRSEDFAARVAKAHGAGIPLEDLDVWDLSERRAQLAGMAHRLLEAQAILKDDPGDQSAQLRALVEEPETVELGNGRTVDCYPITIPVAVTIAQRQDVLRKCVASIMAAEGSRDAATDRHKLDQIRIWQRAALMYEATLPPGSAFRLPIDPPWLARRVAGAVAWLDGSNRWDRQFWRTWAVATWCWRVVDWLVPGRWLARITGVPSGWCWTVSIVDEVAIVRGHLAANDERARGLPKLHHSGEAKAWSWSAFASAMASDRNQFPKRFIHDVSMLAQLTDFSITAARRQEEERKREADRKKNKSGRSKRRKGSRAGSRTGRR